MLKVLQFAAGILGGLLFGITGVYAIDGGPPFPGGTNVVGTYGGVLTPKASPCPSVSPEPVPACSRTLDSCAANSIGVFSVSAPQSGLATGDFVMFAQGRVFTGTISGVADPGKLTLKGVLSARFDFTVTFAPTPCPVPVGSCTPSERTERITATANGNLKTRIRTNSDVSTAATSIRLKGTGVLDISHGQVDGDLAPIVACEIPMKVVGFKQSNTATATAVGTP